MRMTAARTACLAVVVLGAAACGSVSTLPSSYVLSADAAADVSGDAPGPAVAVGPITIPAYLDRSGVVLRGAGDSVVISARHEWAEPLGDAVSRVLAENLAAMVPTAAVAAFPSRTPWNAQFRVTVEIVRLDGPLAGPVVLSARWRLLDDAGTTLATKALIARETVSEPTYAGLVAAEGRLLATLSRAVATEIRRHLTDPRATTQPTRSRS